VVAVSRNGSFLSRVNGQTRIEAGDDLYICGNAEGLREIAL
jgi:Trk K+ transport system NAD-binding subunit